MCHAKKKSKSALEKKTVSVMGYGLSTDAANWKRSLSSTNLYSS